MADEVALSTGGSLRTRRTNGRRSSEVEGRKLSNAHSKFKIWFTDDKTTLVNVLTETCCFNSTEVNTIHLYSFNILNLEIQEVTMTPENDTTPPNVGGVMVEEKPPNTYDKRYCRPGFRKAAPTGRPVLRQPKFEGACDKLKGHISTTAQTQDNRTCSSKPQKR
jgi:hypothetical protein